MAKITIPTFDQLMNPLVQALKDLGGSGTIEEIYNKVAEIAGLTNAQLEVPHAGGREGRTSQDWPRNNRDVLFGKAGPVN